MNVAKAPFARICHRSFHRYTHTVRDCRHSPSSNTSSNCGLRVTRRPSAPRRRPPSSFARSAYGEALSACTSSGTFDRGSTFPSRRHRPLVRAVARRLATSQSLRIRRQLLREHGKRLLRRLPVLALHVARSRHVGSALSGIARSSRRSGCSTPTALGLGFLADMLVDAESLIIGPGCSHLAALVADTLKHREFERGE